MFEHALSGAFDRHGHLLVGVVIFFESMGVPLPGESLLIGAALWAAHQGGAQIEWIVASAAIGAILGDNAGYLIGQRVGPPVLARWGPKIGLTAERQRLGAYLFLKHGSKVVFFGRFTAFLRTFAAVLAGVNRMPWRRFLVWNALGGITWSALYGVGAYVLGNQIKRIVGPIGIGLAVLAGIGAVWLWLFLRRHEARLIRELAPAPPAGLQPQTSASGA